MKHIYLSSAKFAGRYGNHDKWPFRRAKLDPDFPQPVRLSRGCTRWKLSDIEAWEKQRAAKN